MVFNGYVTYIVFRNEENSYTVARFTLDNEETISITGYLPFVEEGDTLKIFGKFVTHSTYGKQFKIDNFEKVASSNDGSLEKFLSSGTVKGIGPATAKKIINKFGDDAVNVLKSDPEKLSKIKGISYNKAVEICDEFNEKSALWQIAEALGKFGINPGNTKKVFEALGTDAVKKIEENPYILIGIIYGLNFNKIDIYALKEGISRDSDFRIKAGIKYAIFASAYNGNTCTLKENLITYVGAALGVSREYVENNIINLKAEEQIVVDKDNYENEWVYLYPYYKIENNISTKLNSLKKFKNIKHIKNFNNKLKAQEEKLDITLSEKQFEALDQINDNNVCIITGGPGTRKNNHYKIFDKHI